MPLKKNVLCTVCLCITQILLICGCGTKTSSKDPSSHDWRTGEWKSGQLTDNVHTLYLSDSTEGLEADRPGARSSKYCTWGNDLFGLDCFLEKSADSNTEEWTCALNCYETGTGDIRQISIELPDLPDYKEMEKVVDAFDIMSGQELILFVRVRQDGNTGAYLAVHMSMEGEYLDTVNLQTADGSFSFESIHVDSRGYCYGIPDSRQGTVLVWNPDGSPAEQMRADREDMAVQFACKDPDGNLIFKWHRNGEGTLQLAGYEPGRGKKVYAEEALPWEGPIALTEDGYLYYGGIAGNLYRWNLYTGNKEFCIDYGRYGIGTNPYTLYMAVDAKGNPVLLDDVDGSAKIYETDTERRQTETIRLVSLAPFCDYISVHAANFSREWKDYEIIIEEPIWDGRDWGQYFSEMETFRDRAMMEIIAGNGADLYFVTREDMEILYGNGVLADLTDVLPAEMKECIFPGVLDGGMIDGRLIGLAPEGYVTVAMISDELWPEDSWTLEEALGLLESNPQLKYLFINPVSKTSAPQMLFDVFLQDLNNSPFLDMEKGTCDFNNPLFIRLLEYTGNYGPSGIWESDPLEDGIAAGFYQIIQGYAGFTFFMDEYGDEYHPVGFPTNGGSGNYWTCDYYLVMSKNTPYREVLEKYLVELFDAENQRDISNSVRNDLLSRYVVYNDFDPGLWGGIIDNEWLYDRGNGEYYPVKVKPDGSFWDDEYLQLMNSCVQRSGTTEPIINILKEELDSYYFGNKDAVTVAGIIQNKVQLYLDEHR